MNVRGVLLKLSFKIIVIFLTQQAPTVCILSQLWVHTSCLALAKWDQKGDEARPWGCYGLRCFLPICISSHCHVTHYNCTASWNSKPDLSHRFRCWGIQGQFSWWLRLSVFHEFSVKVSASCSHLKAGSGLENLLPISRARSHGCWQENSVPPLMALSTGLLKCPYMTSGFPQSE